MKKIYVMIICVFMWLPTAHADFIYQFEYPNYMYEGNQYMISWSFQVPNILPAEPNTILASELSTAVTTLGYTFFSVYIGYGAMGSEVGTYFSTPEGVKGITMFNFDPLVFNSPGLYRHTVYPDATLQIIECGVSVPDASVLLLVVPALVGLAGFGRKRFKN